jgi:hypothetical protein
VRVRPTDRLRLELARRPWVHRALVGATALLVAWLVHGHALTVDRERARWGETVEVYVARTDLVAGVAAAPGVELVERPAAMVPTRALGADQPLEATATVRRAVDAGEILTDLDVAGDDRPGTLAPAGSLVVPVAEAVPSAPPFGAEVVVAVDGLALAEGVVVGTGDGIVLVAVPAAHAPAVAAASAGSVAVLLLVP